MSFCFCYHPTSLLSSDFLWSQAGVLIADINKLQQHILHWNHFEKKSKIVWQLMDWKVTQQQTKSCASGGKSFWNWKLRKGKQFLSSRCRLKFKWKNKLNNLVSRKSLAKQTGLFYESFWANSFFDKYAKKGHNCYSINLWNHYKNNSSLLYRLFQWIKPHFLTCCQCVHEERV